MMEVLRCDLFLTATILELKSLVFSLEIACLAT